MIGAQAMTRTLVAGGVDVCFANPGTSEMHFVAALDAVPEMRGVLALFEGVATGAADGYARIAGRPAGVLLHLGPGLGNGLANLHNARRAGVPLVVVVGDHALFHKPFDAPLESDIDAVAGSVSGWVRRTARPADVGADTAAAIAYATANRQVATLILPADVSWSAGAEPAAPAPAAPPAAAAPEVLDAAAAALRSGERTMLLLGGDAAGADGMRDGGRICAQTGADWLCETFPTRWTRGAGIPRIDKLAYFAEGAEEQLAGVRHLILAGARSPVSFFGYPGRASDLVPPGCQVHTLGGPHSAAAALAVLAEAVAPGVPAPANPLSRPALPTGPLTASTVAAAVGALLPEHAIVVDESLTASFVLTGPTAGAPQHDWLSLTGGAIGYGMPAAVGAAVAAPHRPVLSLQADGSAMYTVSALWTQAREGLDVTTVIFNNGSYDILRIELARVNAGTVGPAASKLFDLTDPRLDFVKLAEGMGVPARRATTSAEFAAALAAAFAEPGPHLIEAMVPALP